MTSGQQAQVGSAEGQSTSRQATTSKKDNPNANSVQRTRAWSGMWVVIGGDVAIAVAATFAVWKTAHTSANLTPLVAILTSAFTAMSTMTTAYFGIKTMSNTAQSFAPAVHSAVTGSPAGGSDGTGTGTGGSTSGPGGAGTGGAGTGATASAGGAAAAPAPTPPAPARPRPAPAGQPGASGRPSAPVGPAPVDISQIPLAAAPAQPAGTPAPGRTDAEIVARTEQPPRQ
jgi:hypothetical protein